MDIYKWTTTNSMFALTFLAMQMGSALTHKLLSWESIGLATAEAKRMGADIFVLLRDDSQYDIRKKSILKAYNINV